MKMMTMMMAIIFASVRLSWAQEVGPCWTEIADCETHVDEHHGDDHDYYDLENECCPVMVKAAKDDVVCFCSVTPSIEGNATTLEAFDGFLSLCHIDSSFSTYCEDVAAPTSTPIGHSSPPSSSLSDNSSIIVIYNIYIGWQNQPLPPLLPKSGGLKLEMLIPSIVIPTITVIIALIKLYFIIRDRNHRRKNSSAKGNVDDRKIDETKEYMQMPM